MTADIDRLRPFCWPSWLSDVGQNPYSNLNERLMAYAKFGRNLIKND